MLESYPSLYNLGHAAVTELLRGHVIIEEKIDGSQFSFGVDETGEVFCRSKGKQINMADPEQLFNRAVETVIGLHAGGELDNLRGYTFRCEYLAKPKHNVLAYDRTPKRHLIVFDVSLPGERYLNLADKTQLAGNLGLEVVPCFHNGFVPGDDAMAFLNGFLERDSILGGQKVEGVVLKPGNYDLFSRDKRVLIGKLVSAAFREVHAGTWKAEHGPKSGNDIIQLLARDFGTPARWSKARIHLREAGKIEDSPRDIGELMKEIPADVQKECEAEIRERLFTWAWPQLKRAITRGVPEWYKNLLLEETAQALAEGPAEGAVVSAWMPEGDRGHGFEVPGGEKNRLEVSPV